MYDYELDCMTIFLEGISGQDRDLILSDFYSARAWTHYVSPQDAENYAAFFEKIRQEVCAASVRIRWGTEFDFLWYEISGMPVLDTNGKIVQIVGRISDVTREKKRHDELERRAKTDSMTELLNKVAFEEECKRILINAGEQEHYALLVIDINGLKTFNDNFGHLYGDRVIKIVATAVSSLFGKHGVVGRIGGDEFAILMRYAQKIFVADRIESLYSCIKNQCSEMKNPVHVSVGTAYFREAGRTYQKLFLEADREMYFSKKKQFSAPIFCENDDSHNLDSI